MTVRVINGIITYREIPYLANSSQDIIEDMSEDEARCLIGMGYAVKIDDPPKPPLQIFKGNSEKTKAKIAELSSEIAEAEKEKETLLGDEDLLDVAGIAKKINDINGQVSTLREFIRRQQAKLEKEIKHEALEKEKETVKKFAETTKQQRKDAEKALSGIAAALSALKQHMAALDALRSAVSHGFFAAGGGYEKSPLLLVLALSNNLTKDAVENMQDVVKNNLANLDAFADRTADMLGNILCAKHFKTMGELQAEQKARDRDRIRKTEPEPMQIEIHTPKKRPDNPADPNYWNF
jgi:DNA repair exonuclease SbcCD ATPase subunit